MHSLRVRPNCRMRSTPPMPGTSTANSNAPWMRFNVRPTIRKSQPSPEANVVEWPSAACCFSNPTCCFSTNRPTTLTPSQSTGSNNIFSNIPARSLPSPTTATSLTMWPDGFLNSTAAREFPGKATTHPGLTRRPSAWPWKRSRPANAARHWSASSNGCAWLPKPVRRRAKRVSQATTDCSTKTRSSAKNVWKSSSPTVHVWVRR